MTTKTKIKWRLANRPTAAEVTDLLKAELLTKDEAREILFSLETEEDRNIESLQEEIKFLRGLVDKLGSRHDIVTYIPQVLTPNYQKYPFYQPYQIYCSTAGAGGSTTNAIYTSGTGGSGSIAYLANGTSNTSSTAGLTMKYSTTANDPFTSIKTF